MKIYFEDLTVNGSPLVWEVIDNKKAQCLNYCVRTPSVKHHYEVINTQILNYEEQNKETFKKGKAYFEVKQDKDKVKFFLHNPFALDYEELESKKKSNKERIPPLPLKTEERKVSFNKFIIEPYPEKKRKRSNSTSSSSSPRTIPIPSAHSVLRKPSNTSMSSDQTSPRSDNSAHLISPHSMFYTPPQTNRSLGDESPRTISSIITTPRSISLDSSPLEQITLETLITEKNSEAWRSTCAFKVLYEKSIDRMNNLRLPIIQNINSLRHISLCQITLNGHESKIKVFQQLVELLEFINRIYTLWFNRNKDHCGQSLLRNHLINAILDAMTIRARNQGHNEEKQILDPQSYKSRAQEMLTRFRALLLEDQVQEDDDELYALIIELQGFFLAQSDDFIDHAKAKLTKVEEAVIHSLVVYFNNKQFNADNSIDTLGFISFQQMLKEQGIKSSKIKNIISKSIQGLLNGQMTQNEEAVKYKYTPNLDAKDKDFYIAEEYQIPVENLIKQHFSKSKNETPFKGAKEKKGSDFVRNFITFITDEEIRKLKSISEKEPEAMILSACYHP